MTINTLTAQKLHYSTLKEVGFRVKEDKSQRQPQIGELERNNWLVMPYEFTKGKYSLEVDPARLEYNPVVEKTSKELEINYKTNKFLKFNFKNTAKDSLGRNFIGNINWGEAMIINQSLGNKTATLREAVDYINLLKLGSQGDIDVYDVSGKKVDSKLCEKYFFDSTGKPTVWKGEFFDARFQTIYNSINFDQNHIFNSNGKIIKMDSEELAWDTLISDIPGTRPLREKTFFVDVEEWIQNATRQGLPRITSKKGARSLGEKFPMNYKRGDLHYLPPRKNDDPLVAGIIGGTSCSDYFSSGNLFLGCNLHEIFEQAPIIGVRATRLKK